MENKKGLLGGRTIVGLFFVIIGALFLLGKFGIIGFMFTEYIFSLPIILLIIGGIIILNSNDISGYILATIGGIILLSRHYGFNAWDLWPIFLIIVGLYILLHTRQHPHKEKKMGCRNNFTSGTISDDVIDEIAVFGGGKKSIVSKNFKGGKATAIFGGVELDFYEASLSKEENTIDCIALFGGISLFVPRDWKVIIKITPIFGGVNDERRKDPNTVFTDEKVLIVKGLVLFGGCEIKNA